MQCMLEMLTAVGRGEYVSRQAFTYLARYTTEACKHKASLPVIAPFLHDTLLHVLLPTCFFTDALHEQWTNDPMEVIRKNSTADITLESDDFYDVRDAAISAVLDLMRIKPLQAQLLEPLMKEVASIAQAFRARHGAIRRAARAARAPPPGVPPAARHVHAHLKRRAQGRRARGGRRHALVRRRAARPETPRPGSAHSWTLEEPPPRAARGCPAGACRLTAAARRARLRLCHGRARGRRRGRGRAAHVRPPELTGCSAVQTRRPGRWTR